jgi:Regulator of ribonuclease activity B
MTPLADLETMFDNMRSQTSWDVGGDLLWGYFFFDFSPAKLQRLADVLEKSNYKLANLYQSDDETTHVLHMEKIETHSPQSLFTRNEELQQLALAHKVASYDGMDVGPLNLI